MHLNRWKLNPLVLSLTVMFGGVFLTACSDDSQQKAAEAVEDVKQSTSEAYEEAKQTTQEVMDETQEAVSDSVDSAQEAAESAGEEASDMAESASETTQEAINEASEEVDEAVAAVSVSGQDVYSTCVGCHGANGEGGVGPKLSGQAEDALVEKLKTYRSGKEIGPMSAMMIPNAQQLSDAEIKAVSSYITTL
ncbi:Cytochrome c-554(548) [Hydrogenovibrio crunogenus]|uniref:Cytochrome c-554(548) n=1 Tax=Hydrogenovibrio crunogenus TaxID=39765 RepID=A0A4V1C8T0_9GAMM|nr:c-type cytochrome [Hydrogenovibrio crunogenus]QBZ82974.1 Cytochrome c-554(548) [Hydrogenovibrio crunogenus]